MTPRKKVFTSSQRIVVKVGSRLLVDDQGVPSAQRIEELVEALYKLRQKGKEIILVSSGAIASGMSLLGMEQRPKHLPELQVCAAAGQSRLMSYYEQACVKRGFHCAQLLLLADDVRDRHRHLNLSNCLNTMLRKGVMPIINENDSLSVKEIRFGENDELAALVGIMSKSDLTVLMTSINGLHTLDSSGQPDKRISIVNDMNDDIRSLAGDTDGNQLSTGGMHTKLNAATILNQVGESLWIIDGQDFSALDRLAHGDDIGTLFPASLDKMSSLKRWLGFFPETQGSLGVDLGAEKALCYRGKSLLPGGLISVCGTFEKGDIVDILNPQGDIIARGQSNYSNLDLNIIKGHQSSDIDELLGGSANYAEAIHRDNLVILKEET
ncbi:glutamate 5-kinase [Lentisphaera profundi]|uniref:Glutamate 5-kinase n=1 Tax=Lentisphaera profundi TaxID=1658616 RepID=A0ABY7VV49_9BACT|nr:glutamate 5-kinase [Lentisphaera profundi]WDE97090.1 glutamate 5-kinase [Lentisphaera profundi]